MESGSSAADFLRVEVAVQSRTCCQRRTKRKKVLHTVVLHTVEAQRKADDKQLLPGASVLTVLVRPDHHTHAAVLDLPQAPARAAD